MKYMGVFRSSLLTLIGLILFTTNIFAQEREDRAKFELIRETIQFLATDQVVSRDTSFRIACETLDYACFERALAAEPITGITSWFNRWRNTSVTDESSLKALRDRIFGDILERAGKGYRKQLDGYTHYMTQVQNITDQYVKAGLVDETMADSVHSEFDSDSLTESEAIPPVRDYEPIYEPETKQTDKFEIMMFYLSLAIAIIAVLIAYVAMNRSKQPQIPLEVQNLPQQLDELSLRLRRLERRMEDTQSKEVLTHLTDIMESVEKRVVALEERDQSS